MFATVVMDEDHHKFEEVLTGYKKQKGYLTDTDMTAEDWKHIVGEYKKIVDVPTDPVSSTTTYYLLPTTTTSTTVSSAGKEGLGGIHYYKDDGVGGN